SAAALTAVMQLVARGALDGQRTIVVVLTSGGLKDPGATRAWLPPVPVADGNFDRLLAVLHEAAGLRLDCWARAGAGWPRRGRARRATEWARAAERSGLGSVWIMEDYFHPGAYAVAAAAAAVSVRGVIGLGVVNPYTRHPAVVAMETATLAAMAPGRVVLGLG